MRKLSVLLFFVSLTLTSCSFFAEDDITELSLSLKSSKQMYESGDKISITAYASGGNGSAEYRWKIDDGSFEPYGSEKEFGPFTDDSSHVITCILSDGEASVEENIFVKSKTYLDLSIVDQYGRLQVIGTNLCSEKGEPIQLRGLSTHGIQYFPNFYTENAIQSIAEEWEADILRVSSYVNEGWKEQYLDNPTKWKQKIDGLVDYCGKYGIYVLIDWHMLSPGDPLYFFDEAIDFWTYMADQHGDKEHVLFDICNEPNNQGWNSYKKVDGEWVIDEVFAPEKSVTWEDHIKPFADSIMSIIRDESENVAIVGTPNWAARPNAVIGNPVQYDNLMYTMHFYAAEHGQSYMNNVETAVNAGIPVFVTEFGTQKASGDEKNDFEDSQEWLDLLNKYNISWINWNFSSDFRTGAVFKTNYSPTTVAEYADTTQLKEAGKWIMNKFKNR